jgi:hypothetical protein
LVLDGARLEILEEALTIRETESTKAPAKVPAETDLRPEQIGKRS